MAQNLELAIGAGSSIRNLHRFSHPAMATVFEIFIIDDDASYAEQAAQEAFNELDRLEQELSRFIANSDVTRINHLAAKLPLRIGLDAFECLKISQQVFNDTSGAFDVTIGTLLQCWLHPDKTLRSPTGAELAEARRNVGMHLLELDEAEHTVTLQASPVHIDLGAVGKGYAVDLMSKILCEWDIERALIHGGRSSVFALGAPPSEKGWPLTFTNPRRREQILTQPRLCQQAASGSGLQKGRHIINPRTAQPLTGNRAAWVITPSAATSDAISTAFMIMEPDEIQAYCQRHPEVHALILTADGEDEKEWRFGVWEEEAIA